MIQKLQDSRAVLLGAVAIFAVGLTTSGYVLGDGLRRAKMAERSVTVRGVSERDVTADIATWSVSFSDEGTTLAPVRARSHRKVMETQRAKASKQMIAQSRTRRRRNND